MSRAYRINVKASLERHVAVEDGVCSQLEVLPILEKERMSALLGDELSRRGFTREGQTARRAQGQGVTVEVNLTTGEVKVTAEGHADLKLETNRTAAATLPDDEALRRKLGEAAQSQLERDAQAEEQLLRRQVTEALEGTLTGLKGELDQAVTAVTAAALKARAAELGTVESVTEGADGSLTIKVRV